MNCGQVPGGSFVLDDDSYGSPGSGIGSFVYPDDTYMGRWVVVVVLLCNLMIHMGGGSLRQPA